MPELAMMMPSQSVNGSGEVKGGVLKPEELQYIDALKKKPESAVKQEPAKKEAAKTEPKTVKAKKTEPAKTEKPASVQVVKKQVASEAEEPVEIDNPGEQNLPKYDYVYQAASFGYDNKAQDFSKKLIASGLDSYVEPGESGSRIWYRVFIRHTGTPDSTLSMKKILRKFGIKKPLLKSKKAAE